MRRLLAIIAVACLAIALLVDLTTGLRHNVLGWIIAGLLALALRAALEGAHLGD